MTDDQVNLGRSAHLCEPIALGAPIEGQRGPSTKRQGYCERFSILHSVSTVLLTGLRSRGCHDPPQGSRGERRAAVVLNAKLAGPIARREPMSQNGMDRPCSRPEPLRECAGA